MALPKINLAAAILAIPLATIPACAASADKTNQTSATDAKIEALQQQLASLQAEIAELKHNSEKYAEAKKQYEATEQRLAQEKKKQGSDVIASLKDGRPSFATADGQFTANIHAGAQADFAYYMQNKKGTSTGTDLSSGGNIRRAQLSLYGKVFGDWSYNFLYDFGSPNTETPGKILMSYLQYDGLGPLAIRVGAWNQAYSVEDQLTGNDLMFLERNTPTDLIRGIAGSEGRLGIGAIYSGSRFFGALAYTAKKIAETGTYDQQSAIVGRASYMAIDDDVRNAHLLVGGGLMHVFTMADSLAAGTTSTTTAMHSLTLAATPELSVDDNGTKLISTGAMGAKHFTALSGEIAGNYQNFYLQGAYNFMQVNRAATPYTVYSDAATSSTEYIKANKNNQFSAWYVQGSWIITGESKTYNPGNGTFVLPRPAHPFSLSKGDWGAWEIAARYSDTNLNDNADDPTSIITGWTAAGTKTYSLVNAVRGGEQKNVTLGINWYPNNAIHFMLDYMWIDVNRLSSTSTSGSPSTHQIGQSLQAVALRSSIQF